MIKWRHEGKAAHLALQPCVGLERAAQCVHLGLADTIHDGAWRSTVHRAPERLVPKERAVARVAQQGVRKMRRDARRVFVRLEATREVQVMARGGAAQDERRAHLKGRHDSALHTVRALSNALCPSLSGTRGCRSTNRHARIPRWRHENNLWELRSRQAAEISCALAEAVSCSPGLQAWLLQSQRSMAIARVARRARGPRATAKSSDETRAPCPRRSAPRRARCTRSERQSVARTAPRRGGLSETLV